MRQINIPFALRLSAPNEISAQSATAIRLYRDNQQLTELNHFRQQLGEDLSSSSLFAHTKRKLQTYSLLFAGLSAFFIFLALTLWTHTLPLTLGNLSVAESILFKNMMGGLAALFAGFCFWIGAKLRADQDAAHYLMQRAKKQLKRLYNRKRVDRGLTQFFSFQNDYAHSIALKTSYQEILESMRELHQELLHLFEHIRHSSGMKNSSREHLYNQALIEFSSKLAQLLEEFKSSF